MARRCECRVGPGRYEGEPVLTALCHVVLVEGGEEHEVSYSDGSWAVYAEIETLTVPLDPMQRAEILGYGYCERCLVQCLAEIAKRQIHTVTYGSDSQGFLWSVSWEDRDKAWEAFEADQEEMAWEGEEE